VTSRAARRPVDIAEFTQSQEIFRFVRLTDLKESCGSCWPGADIDAAVVVCKPNSKPTG
jgi:hypothetical protein